MWYKDGVLLPAETDPSLSSVPGKGVYKVEVDSNSCTMSDEMIIVDTLFDIQLLSGSVLTDSIVLTAGDPAAGYTYQWYKNGTPIINANSYSLKVFDTCKTIFSVEVDYPSCGTKSAEFKVLCVRDFFKGMPLNVPGIIQAEDYDVQNVPSTTYFDTDAGNNGGAYRSDGVDIEVANDGPGQFNVGWTQAGEWMEYSIRVTDPGTCGITFRIASNVSSGGKLHLKLNGVNVTGTVDIPFTGGWQAWRNVVVNGINFTEQDTLLRVYVETGGFNLNYIKVEKGFVNGIDDKNIQASINIYPNPTSRLIRFSGEKNTWDWILLNNIGKEMMKGSGDYADISSLEKGHYILFINERAFKIIKF
jgi:hypothetical protein